MSGSIQRKDRVRGQRVNSCWRVKVTRYRCSMLPGSQWCILGTEHQLNPSICFLTFGFWPLIHFCFCDSSIIGEWWDCYYRYYRRLRRKCASHRSRQSFYACTSHTLAAVLVFDPLLGGTNIHAHAVNLIVTSFCILCHCTLPCPW